MRQFAVELDFHGDLPCFLKPKKQRTCRQLNERTSVKDVIEACGVPHTEIDLILVDAAPVDFSFVIGRECKIDIYGVDENSVTSFSANRLQVRQIREFVADGHLGKLVRDLRLLGIDVIYDPLADDPWLVEIAASQDRALLTRDRRLLMRAPVRHGYYPRSQEAFEQTLEVLRRFELGSYLRPFSRCLRCNAPVKPVPKEAVFEKLEPLTKIYYEQFRNCSGCGQIYWSGSHFHKLRARVEQLRAAISARSNLT